jgi:hypothetical protein
MDVCPRVSVLCCPVSVEALRRADPPSKESCQIFLYVDREAHESAEDNLKHVSKLSELHG